MCPSAERDKRLTTRVCVCVCERERERERDETTVSAVPSLTRGGQRASSGELRSKRAAAREYRAAGYLWRIFSRTPVRPPHIIRPSYAETEQRATKYGDEKSSAAGGALVAPRPPETRPRPGEVLMPPSRLKRFGLDQVRRARSVCSPVPRLPFAWCPPAATATTCCVTTSTSAVVRVAAGCHPRRVAALCLPGVAGRGSAMMMMN